MSNLVERYIYDVIRRLPEKDREDVRQELSSNIYDMLSDKPSQNEIKAVLNELGSPALLAEQYRSEPQYLISPAIYDDYIRTLKWVVPLVGCILLVVGMIVGAISAIQGSELVDISYLLRKVFGQGLSLGISGAFQALVWTTIGFIVADRTSTNKKREEWQVDDLPEKVETEKQQIPLSDSIAELVFTVIFICLAILFCLNLLPFVFIIKDGPIEIKQLFTSSFLTMCIPVLVVTGVFNILECVVKIKDREWTPLVCGTVIASNIVGIGTSIFLLTRPNIFNQEFLAYMQSRPWGDFDLLKFFGQGVNNPIIMVILAIIIIASIASCISAIYKTTKAAKER